MPLLLNSVSNNNHPKPHRSCRWEPFHRARQGLCNSVHHLCGFMGKCGHLPMVEHVHHSETTRDLAAGDVVL